MRFAWSGILVFQGCVSSHNVVGVSNTSVYEALSKLLIETHPQEPEVLCSTNNLCH